MPLYGHCYTVSWGVQDAFIGHSFDHSSAWNMLLDFGTVYVYKLQPEFCSGQVCLKQAVLRVKQPRTCKCLDFHLSSTSEISIVNGPWVLHLGCGILIHNITYTDQIPYTTNLSLQSLIFPYLRHVQHMNATFP